MFSYIYSYITFLVRVRIFRASEASPRKITNEAQNAPRFVQTNEAQIVKRFVQLEISDIIHIADCIRNNPNLTTLQLIDCGIHDEMMKILAEAIYQNTTLKTIDLNGNYLSDDSATLLVRIIRDSTTLETLDLHSNTFTIKGIDALLNELNNNLIIINFDISVSAFWRTDVYSEMSALKDRNKLIREVINENTPPLGNGWSDAGDFDALPNEMLCQIAMLVWPTHQAIILAHTCRRWRDVVMSDLVIMDRCDTKNRVTPRNLFRALKT